MLKLSNVEARQWGGIYGILRDQCLVFGLNELRSSADNDAVRLRTGAVTGIACSVEKVCSVSVVEDPSTPIVAAIRIGHGELELALLIDARDNPQNRCWYRIGRIYSAWRVGVGYIERVDRCEVTHERQELMIQREIRGSW
jgi:hypothetical protein